MISFQPGFDKVIRAVVQYIRALPHIDDYEQLCQDVFGAPKDPRVKRLKASMTYYSQCTQEGYQKQQKPKHVKKRKYPTIKTGSSDAGKQERKGGSGGNSSSSQTNGQEQQQQQSNEQSRQKQQHADLVERIGETV